MNGTADSWDPPDPDDVGPPAPVDAAPDSARSDERGSDETVAGRPAPTDAPPPGSAAEDEPVDEPEEAPDPAAVLARLTALLGAPSSIGVGDVRVRGQNATGPGATAIGTVNITTATVGAGGRTWSETLSGTWVRQLADGYAPAPSDQRLDRQLKLRHLVCLTGPDGTGRHTAGCLASARRYGYDRVGVLDAEHLSDLLGADAPVRPGHGYTLALGDEAVRELDGLTLVGLAVRLETLGSSLVLVGDFAHREQEFTGQLVPHRPAASVEVFRAQLRRLLRGQCVGWCADHCTGDCVDAYVEEECVPHPLLAAHLAGGPRAGEVVRLAELIAQAPPRGGDLTERLERLLPRQLRERARRVLCVEEDGVDGSSRWDVDQRRAFRLSCAVLAGQSVVEVQAAAGRLLTGPAPDTDGATTPPVGFLGGVVDLLLGPVLRQAVVLVDDDRLSGGRRIEFSPGNDQLRTSLLEVAWSDWWLPEHLLGWLATLVRTGSPGVREAAAGAVGWSARHGVRVALETVDQLARERRAGVRQAAAIALVAMAMQPELRQRVRTELDRWASVGPAHLRDTVARAYALGLARLWPDTALLHLRQIAGARMQRWHHSVVRGLVEVHTAGHQATVLPALAQWTRSPDPEVWLHAGRALRVLADRWAPAPREHWPELLDLARVGTVSTTDLADCWANALSLPTTAYRAWRTLGFWLNRADGHPEVAAHCLELLALVVAGRAPLRHRLDHQLSHVWGPLMPHNSLLAAVRRLTDEDHR
ncbi:hypothetical protein [Micromonospora antibiotica]|uniref:Uncharacterized protein n=1 Tax=Micromonospora antibiotica TaxID=2807623 RepID=A0ABS3VGJ1_9ACTN|nr:hypothetical protein [Micromonospora antibiotica]MBO4164669.1 hypothetical protein [Micromonospora antibiotica]